MEDMNILNILGWMILWGIGSVVIPLLSGMITVMVKGEKDTASVVTGITFVLYFIATAITLIII